MTQVFVEGWQDLVHAPQRTGRVILEQLHPGHRPLSAPERGGMGRKSQK